MQYITTKEAEEKWNISERRIRQLLSEGRIEGAVKVGGTWNIPIDAIKPTDKRVVKQDNNEFIINLDNNYFNEVDSLKKELDSKRPISKETLKSLKESINLEWTYNSNGIEGNTLTLRETQVVLEGITVGGKTITEHLEAINHEKAILYLDDLVKDKQPITEWNIKNIHQLILKEIDNENAGRYRKENVTIKGALHIPPDSSKNDLLAIADAKLSVYNVSRNLKLNIKNSSYTVGEILGDNELAREYAGGKCLVYRLTVDDYHRYHYLDGGFIKKKYRINGELHTVRPISSKYNVFSRNTREISVLSTYTFGDVVQVEVGAMLIGCIKNHKDVVLFGRLEEKGYFEYGGSTIILLFKKDCIRLDKDIEILSKRNIEAKVRIGEKIGELI